MPMVVNAPAKLNLYLAVGDLLPSGYHSVTTVLVALDLADRVTVTPAPELSLVCEPEVGVGACDNLGWRAAVAMGEAFGSSPDFAIRIDKIVPAGAGLAGGSADAAAVIAAMASMWDVSRHDPRLESVASSLGADVPFALRGGCAIYRGRGATFGRALRPPRAYFAIIKGDEAVSTAAAYSAFDLTPREPAPGSRYVANALAFEDTPALGAALYNNMAPAAIHLVPGIENALAFMRTADGCHGSALCGSGSAVFGLFSDEEHARSVASAARERGMWSAVARAAVGGTLDQTMGVGLD